MAKLELLSKEFPRLRRRLELSDFAPELAGNSVDVWLNPSRELIERQAALSERVQAEPDYAGSDEAGAENAVIFAELWDCTQDEAAGLLRIEAPLTGWLVGRTFDMIGEYRAGRLAKNPTSG